MIAYCGVGGYITGKDAIANEIPWLRPDATRYLLSNLPDNSKIFEWGMGSSTIWFANLRHNIISMELNSDWFKIVDECLAKNDLDLFASISLRVDMEDYADYILRYPDEHFDLVMIDGRNRCRCLGNSLSKVKIGGMLCLDNSEREEYQKAVGLLDTWDGYSWGDKNWMTTIWHKSDYSLANNIKFPNEDA